MAGDLELSKAATVTLEEKATFFGNLHDACIAGCEASAVACINSQFSSCRELIKEADFAPLHLSVVLGHSAMVAFLSGIIDVNLYSDKFEGTPLYLAAKRGHLEIVESLQTHGAKDCQPVTDPQSSLHQAILNGHLCVADHLLRETDTTGVESVVITLAIHSGLLALVEKFWSDEVKVDGEFCHQFLPDLFKLLDVTVDQFNWVEFRQFLLVVSFSRIVQERSDLEDRWAVVHFLLERGATVDRVVQENFSTEVVKYLNDEMLSLSTTCKTKFDWSSKHLSCVDYISLLSPVQECLQELNLSRNCLTHLPNEVPWRLFALERLTINNSTLKLLPGPTEEVLCTRLTKVIVSGNRFLREVPEAIFHLSQLRELDLSGNRLKYLVKDPTKEVCSCSSLENLNLSGNRLKAIHSTFLSGAVSLKTFQLQDNRLSKLPEPWKCPLVKLNASHNQLTSVPEGFDIWRLSLQQLDLSHNLLKEIPLGVCVIRSLQQINVSHNKLEDLPAPEHWKCAQLRAFNLSYNNIGQSQQQPKNFWNRTRSLSSSMKVYTEDSSSSGSKELALPTVFAGRLSFLDLSFNNLQWVPLGVCQLHMLSDLNLSGNPNITDLPNELARLQALDILVVSDLDLTAFPIELNPRRCANKVPTVDIMAYLRSLLRKEQNYNFMKMIFVGPEGCGKTALIRNITGLNGAKSTDETTVPLVTYDFKLTSNSHSLTRTLVASKQHKSVHSAIWDLASSVKYHSVHQCFMTDRALYVVVVRLDSSDLHQTVSHWLLTIRARAPHSAVLIVGTHAEWLGNMSEFDVKRLKQEILEVQYKISDCPRVEDIVMVSNDTGHSIAVLKETLYKICQSIVRASNVPKSYLMIHTAIDKEKIRRKLNRLPPWLSEDELWQLISTVAECDVKAGDQEELAIMTKLFHQTGLLLHYADSMRTLESNYFYLDPVWLSERLSKVIDGQGSQRKLSHECVMKLLADDQNQGNLAHVFELMQRFELILSLNKNRWLIPCRLAKEPPEIELELKGPLLCRMYRMGFTPPGFWSRLLVRLLMRLRDCVTQIHQRQRVSQAKETYQPDLLRRGTMARQRSIVKTSSVTHTWQTFYWAEGLVIQHSDGYLRVESLKQSPVAELFSADSQYSDGICVIAHSKVKLSGLDYSYFSLAVDEVDLLISEWFPEVDFGEERIRRFVMCPTCLHSVWFDETEVKSVARGVGCFPLESVAGCAQKSNRIVCPMHEDTPVPMEHLIPDLLLHDVPSLNQINPAKLRIDEFVARGGQASIHRGTFRNQDVALKVFYFAENEQRVNCGELDVQSAKGLFGLHSLQRLTSMSVRDELDLSLLFAYQRTRKEVMFLTALNHPNIIGIVGVLNQPEAPFLGFALEFAPYGSLLSYLTKERAKQTVGSCEPADIQYGCTLPRLLTYKVAWQIVVAMGYLHRQGIVYRDLKADNVLLMSTDVTDLVNVKLSDYGISSYLDAQGMMGTEGTPGFQAPEILKNMVYDERADMFSYGMVLFELMSGQTPFGDLHFIDDIRRAVKRGKRPCLTQDAHVIPGFIELERRMEQCWHDSPAARPSGALVRDSMEDIFFYCLKAELAVKSANDLVREDFVVLEEVRHLTDDYEPVDLLLHSYRTETGSEYLWVISGDSEGRMLNSINADKCVIDYEMIRYPGNRLQEMKTAGGYLFALTNCAVEPLEVFTFDPNAKLPVLHSVVTNKIDLRALDIRFVCLETLLQLTGEVILAVGTNSSQVYLFKWTSRDPTNWCLLKILQLNSSFLPVRQLMFISKYETLVAACGAVVYLISGGTFFVEETIVNSDYGCVAQLCQTADVLLISFDDLPIVRGFQLKSPRRLLFCLDLSEANMTLPNYITVDVPEAFDVAKLKEDYGRLRRSSGSFTVPSPNSRQEWKKRRSLSSASFNNRFERLSLSKRPLAVDAMACHEDVLWMARSDGQLLLVRMDSTDGVGELLAVYNLPSEGVEVETIVSLDSHVAVLLTAIAPPLSKDDSTNGSASNRHSVMIFTSSTVGDIDTLRRMWRKLRKAELKCC